MSRERFVILALVASMAANVFGCFCVSHLRRECDEAYRHIDSLLKATDGDIQFMERQQALLRKQKELIDDLLKREGTH